MEAEGKVTVKGPLMTEADTPMRYVEHYLLGCEGFPPLSASSPLRRPEMCIF